MKSSESDRQEDAQQQQRLQTLQDFYTAEDAYIKAGGGDFSAIARTLDPDCVVRQPISLPYGGVWRGHAGVEAWMKEFAQQWAVLGVENSQTFVQGDFIFSRSHVHAAARRSGNAIEWPLLQMFEFRESKILELQPFYWDTAKLISDLAERPK